MTQGRDTAMPCATIGGRTGQRCAVHWPVGLGKKRSYQGYGEKHQFVSLAEPL